MCESLREKLTQARFEEEAARTCAAEAQTHRTVLVADSMAAGVRRTQAERDAAFETHHMLDLA